MKHALHPANPDEPPSYEEATSNIDLLVVAAPAPAPAAPPATSQPKSFIDHLAAAAAEVGNDLGCAATEVRRELGCAAEEVRRELMGARGEVTKSLVDASTEVQKGMEEVRSLFGWQESSRSRGRSGCHRRSGNRPLTGCKSKCKSSKC
jgi:hypothetical protein